MLASSAPDFWLSGSFLALARCKPNDGERRKSTSYAHTRNQCSFMRLFTCVDGCSREPLLMSGTCNRCQDVCWVCEKHPNRPHATELANGCECRAGVPCPDCQPHVGRSVRRVRGNGSYSRMSSGEPTEYTFEVNGHSPPMSPSGSVKGSDLRSETARAPPPQRTSVAVRAQVRRR